LLYGYQLVFLHYRRNGRREIEAEGGFCHPFAMLVAPHLLCLAKPEQSISLQQLSTHRRHLLNELEFGAVL
jgi:hypothetical protein